MKKAILLNVLILSAALLSAQGIKIKGSDTVLPLSQKEAENFMKKNKTEIIVTGGGSGVGIAALEDGTTDIAMSSRSLKMEEKLKLNQSNKPFKTTTIAYDALALIVNPTNKISQLSREQLEDIFTGKVTNWKEVGGADMRIIVYSRESSSGTFEFIKEHVMLKKDYTKEALMKPATGDIVQSVSQTKGAIGYVGIAYVDKSVKALKVSFDGKTFVAPSLQTARNGSYPVTRPLFYFYANATEAKVKPFIDYILSAEGQKTIAEVGYIPLK